jgi:excinuclease ABC subunit A
VDLIAEADWVIDWGPEHGEKGGTLMATCTLEELVKVKASHTGVALRAVLARG